MPEKQTKEDLSEWLMDLRKLWGEPGNPLPLNHNFHWAIVEKMMRLRGCICVKGQPSVTVDDGGSAYFVHDSRCGLPYSPADGGPAPIEGENMLDQNTPTEPGFYWHRQIDEGSEEVFEWEVVQILSEQDGPGIIINGTTFQASEIAGVWGPRIPDPDEKREDTEDAAYRERMAHLHSDQELRDLFAAFAMAGFLSNAAPNRPTHDCQTAAQIAYNYADEMIIEREKRNVGD